MRIAFDIYIPISPIVILLVLAVVANFVLAWRVWVSNRKHLVNIYYALAILSAAFWTIGIIFFWLAKSASLISLSLRWNHFWAALIIFFFYFFTYYFPYKTFILKKSYAVIILVATFFILVISVLPNLFIPSVVALAEKFKAPSNLFWHIVCGIYFLGMGIVSFRNLLAKYRRTDGIWRKRLKQVLIATSITYIGGSIFDLIIPIVYNDILGWVGPLFTLFMAAYIGYYIFWEPNRVVN